MSNAYTPSDAAARLTAAYVSTSLAPLTAPGDQHPTLALNLSLDDRGSWVNGIYQNSRFGQFFVEQREDGRARVRLIARGLGTPKFRTITVASTEVALAKVQAWLDAAAAGISA